MEGRPLASATRIRPVALSLAILGALTLPAGIALAATRSVTIAGFAYHPAAITVNVGDRVVWTNSDSVGHTATADNGSFDTGNIPSGGSRGVTFTAAGTYAYYCVPHPSMRGTVVVRAATAGAGGGPTRPDTSTAPGAPVGDGGLAVRMLVLAVAAVFGALLGLRAKRSRLPQLDARVLRVHHAPVIDPGWSSHRVGQGRP